MPVKKTIAKYSNRRQINIKKEDNLKDVTEVVLYTLDEDKNIKSRINNLKQEIATLKQQHQEDIAKIKEQETKINEAIEVATDKIKTDYKNKLQESEATINKLTNEITTQRNHYEDILKGKNETITVQQATIQEKDNTITTLEAKTIEINEIVNQYNEANINKAEKHQKEITSLTEANIYITNKYNGLRQAIINTSKFSYIFGNRKKQLLLEYQEVKPSDKETIEATITDEKPNTKTPATNQ